MSRWLLHLLPSTVSFLFLPLSLPAIVASRIKMTPLVLIILSALVYLIIWFAAFLTTVDSAAYVYGFKRPFFAGRLSVTWFHLGEPRVGGRFDFVKQSLLSYALTLYGFAILYTLISHIDETAFNVKQPLSIFTSIYFAASTAATVGYGDIAPVSRVARAFVTLEIIVSFLYVVTIFSTFAGLARKRISEQETD